MTHLDSGDGLLESPGTKLEVLYQLGMAGAQPEADSGRIPRRSDRDPVAGQQARTVHYERLATEIFTVICLLGIRTSSSHDPRVFLVLVLSLIDRSYLGTASWDTKVGCERYA